MMLQSYIEQAAEDGNRTVAVAAAEDVEVIEAVVEAIKLNFAKFLLFGNREEILTIINERHPEMVRHENLKIIHAYTKELAADHAVKAVKFFEADVLMKGNLPTATLLKAVLSKENGLRTGNVLSHISIFEIPEFDRLLIITDAAMNIAPDLDQKAQIVRNAVAVAKKIGMVFPRVAALSAVEMVNSNMQATIDAAALTLMSKRGQIEGCVIDGPLGLDNAISAFAANHKRIDGEVAGNADILLVPNIEAGNILYKSLVYFAQAKVGAIIAGAKAPIVLTSRADSAESKLYSLALALCCVQDSKLKQTSY
ncbi:phosphate butyryltransferase [Neobacillus sp. LXY-4]|uniref:phosphate butyryltransferase n=1 Tax=Neobacillus sp. LXY-4 TaxID=3379826 RepID=UPI003EDEBE6A